MNRTPSSHPSPPVGEKVPGGRLRGIRTGSRSQCMAAESRGLSMNRTDFECALASKAAEDRRTPRRRSVGHSRAHFRQVLECAGPAALWIALTVTGSWSQCVRKNERGFSMNLRVLPASCRQRNPRTPLPTRRRQHLAGVRASSRRLLQHEMTRRDEGWGEELIPATRSVHVLNAIRQ